MTTALAFRWTDDGAMVPLRAKQADAVFVVGQVYWLEEEYRRSDISHRHEFAWIREAWLQLPEGVADLYPSPEHLRKRALVDAGYYNETVVDAGSNAAALRFAATIRARSEFSLVIVRGSIVLIRDPKSQSRRAMPGDEFQKSKTAIMEVIAAMISVSTDKLTDNAGRAA